MSKKSFMKKSFSLIELLIVIGIMGALAALILPSFSDSESAARDTACDYNQAGTLRYLTMFKAANGVYPSGFHTGLGDGGDYGAEDAVVSEDGTSLLTTCATYNFGSVSDYTEIDSSTDYYESLINAGIVQLANGKGVASDIADGVYVASVKASTASDVATWTETLDPVSGEVDPDGDPLTFRGVNIGWIAAAGAELAEESVENSADVGDASNATGYASLDDEQKLFAKENEASFIIVPLYVAPTIDWDTYYVDGPNDSKISIAMAGKCPWGEGGTNRYYIAFFKVYTDDTAATLLATSCPDCGILEADSF